MFTVNSVWFSFFSSAPRDWPGRTPLKLPILCRVGWWRWALVSPDGMAPSRMVGVSASVNLPLHHKVKKFSSGTGSPGWSWKKGCKTDVVWWWCRVGHKTFTQSTFSPLTAELANCSFREGTVPFCFKHASVVPHLKKPSFDKHTCPSTMCLKKTSHL